jgi:hypothetical protein
MSSSKTAEYFKDKSEEEIMNWMVANMTPEQIRSCFDELPEAPIPEPIPEPIPVPDVKKEENAEQKLNNLREVCANKRYIIHKVVNDTVFFWYYLVKSEKWIYSQAPLSDFPKNIGENAKECGNDTFIKDNFKKELYKSYNQNKLTESSKFEEHNMGDNQNETFIKVKDEYNNKNINSEWVNTLLSALHIQKSIPILKSELKDIINFTPVLIESVKDDKVNYYYLRVNEGVAKFSEANLSINRLHKDFIEIIDDINLEVIAPDQPGSSSAMTVDQWKSVIKTAANNIYAGDLNRIKKIYDKFPLSDGSKYFINDLFNENAFGYHSLNNNYFNNNLFGNKLSKETLKDYLVNKYGSCAAKHYKIETNQFGTKTITF